MFEKYWSLFLVAAIGSIIVEHSYLGIGLSFMGFALARHKEDRVLMDTFSADVQKHESYEGYANIQ